MDSMNAKSSTLELNSQHAAFLLKMVHSAKRSGLMRLLIIIDLSPYFESTTMLERPPRQPAANHPSLTRHDYFPGNMWHMVSRITAGSRHLVE